MASDHEFLSPILPKAGKPARALRGRSVNRPRKTALRQRFKSRPNADQALVSVPAAGFLKWSGRSIFAIGMGGYLAAMALVAIAAQTASGMPSGDSFYTPNRPVSIQIVDRHGRDLLVRGAAEMKRARLEGLPAHVPESIVATEDRRFYSHSGIDPIGLLRAAQRNLKAGYVVQGGSTLSQQLVKNVFLTPEQTYRRKLQEMMLAIWLEYKFTKDEILETYLSRVYFGSGAWGLEAASETYFGKPGAELTVSESAVLAGVLKAPSRYNPSVNPVEAGKRTAIVLGAMDEAGYLTRAERAAALEASVSIKRPATDNSANYFADWIWDEMKSAIGVPSQDIVIQTTLEKGAQAAAADALNRHLDPKRNAQQGAIVTLDGTGGVRVMVGGRSYSQTQFNRAVQAERQPGSAYKAFVYLAGFAAGLTPWNKFEDAPIKMDDWEPRNFSEEFSGMMSLRKAFITSVNTVAVQVTEHIGRERVIETAAALGMGVQQPLRSLALGAQVTTPLQITQAYQPFSNSGNSAPAYGILSISTADGTPLFDRAPSVLTKRIDDKTLGHINRVLVDTVTSGTGQKAQLAGRDVGGKTGTTNDFRDAWFVGFVPDRVTGVWVGADDFSPMRSVTGGSIPARIWRDTMDAVTQDMSVSYIPVSTRPPAEFQPYIEPENSLEALLKDMESVLD